MAGITPDVYDILHPSPVSLKQLSAITVSVEIWRCEINKIRSSDTLKQFHPSGQNISLKTMIPDLPSVIYPTIDKYVKVFGHSMHCWLKNHHDEVFRFHYNHRNRVLEYFVDFVCDYDGGIHYQRTADGMMNCDRFDEDQKFLIACTYCFEDDIKRIYWSFSLKKMDSLYGMYSSNRYVQHWICLLENTIKLTAPSIEEVVFDEFMPHNRSSLEYFWNLIPFENRSQKAVVIFMKDLLSFVRWILPKLNGQQLDEFLRTYGCELLYALLKNPYCNAEVVLSTWMYVKNAMNEFAFTNLIVKMIQSEVIGGCVNSELYYPDEYNLMLDEYVDDSRDLDYFIRLCFEIWNTAAENLKRSAVEYISSNKKLFETVFICMALPPTSRELRFLLAILSYTNYEQRNAFWNNCWCYLIKSTLGKDLRNIMKLCLRDEYEISEFKKNVMTNDAGALCFCRMLLSGACFDELNNFVSFLLPETPAARIFKQKILRLAFLDGRFCDFCVDLVHKQQEFNEFINDAYDDIDLSTDFKNQLMSSSSVQKRLSVNALFVTVEELIDFVDNFVLTEQILLQVKTCMINFLKKEAAMYKCMVPKSTFISVLSWCLEGNEDVLKFEPSYL